MLIVAYCCLVCAWFTLHLSFARDRMECSGGVAHGRCVLTHQDAFNRDVLVRAFSANTLLTAHLITTTQRQHEDETLPTAGRLVILFQDATTYPLHELPIDEARHLQEHIRAFINASRDNVSFDTVPSAWLHVLSLLSVCASALALRWSWVRHAPVQFRWAHNTHSLEVVEPGFFLSRRSLFEIPHNTQIQLRWDSVLRLRKTQWRASLVMQSSTGTITTLTRPRAKGVGVHYQGVVELLRVMDRPVPRPLATPPSPVSLPPLSFESRLNSFLSNILCGTLLGLSAGLILGLELNLLNTSPSSRRPFLSLSALLGMVAVTVFARIVARKRRNDFAAYLSLSNH